MDEMDEEVAQFLAITGTDNERVARGYLDISNGDSQQAIQLFFESPDLASSFANPTSAPQLPPTTTTGRIGREDESGVIHIDSDDDDDVPMSHAGNDRNYMGLDDGGDDDDVAAVARAAQAEEDAAMARRLQDEMYSQGSGGADDVRAPMARTTETLVAPDPNWSLDDDREAAILEQLRRRRQRPGP